MPPKIMFLALAASALASSGAGAAPAGLALEMTGHVETICRAEVRGKPGAPGEDPLPLQTLEEYCNSAGGYEIIVEPSPGLNGAILVVDGVGLPLSAAAPTLVSRSAHAGIASRSLHLRLPAGRPATGGTLTFRIVPLQAR
ncbi:MAG TPA: hypothetical protein VIT45_08700 [Allosphingosinicella sp.]